MPTQLSVVVPAHNSGDRLRISLETLAAELDHHDVEVIIVENGSHDDTWDRAQQLSQQSYPFPVLACQSATGLGAAYHEGIRRASGQVVLLTADDLPFGVSDIQAWRRRNLPQALVIGSKAHRSSVVPRGIVRTLMSGGFRLLRLAVLGMRVADCQGTLFAPRSWLVEQLPKLQETGYLSSTEIVYLAQLQRLATVEIPVTLADSHASGQTRIRCRDIRDMAAGLLRLRRRRNDLR